MSPYKRRKRFRRRVLTLATCALCLAGGWYGLRALRGDRNPSLTAISDSQPAEGAALRLILPPAPAEQPKPADPPPAQPPVVEKPAQPAIPPAAPPTAADRSPTSLPAVAPAGSIDARAEMEAGYAALARNDLVTARTRLNRALHGGVKDSEVPRLRQTLGELAEKTLFSKGVQDGDPLAERYVVSSGNSLVRIARRNDISEDVLASINGITNKNNIREGQTLKVIHGPFHASVSKSEHLIHIYLQDVYVRSYRVALGANGSTPTGRWKVANHLENPGWTDPRTGKRWHANDADNPIGEFWIGLEGVEGGTVGQQGYGIHGTIEPETIGQDVSLGCVRLNAEDIAAVYRLLLPGRSFVDIK